MTVADADLWLNTAELTVSPEVTSIAYREKGAQEWITLTAEEDGTYLIAPRVGLLNRFSITMSA